jgi:NAD(P)-dependent dehydrogenase (short-subunit alcohol dehydrogenase family)
LPSVLITGAGRGIGRVAAQRMASSGWEVLAGVRDLSTGPSGCTPVQLDVASAEDLSALSGRLPERLDAVVNNAGVVVGGPVESLDLDELRHQLEVNVVGQVAVTQAVLGRLRASQGRIVFLSSVSGRVSTPFTGAYNASKFALEALADSLRMELRPWGVAVSLVEPGAIDTDIWRGALETSDGTLAAMSPEHRELYAERVTGLRKTITRTQRQAAPPEKVAEAIAAALTDRRPRARYLVGADARVQIALRGVLPTRAFDATISRLTGGR